MKKGKLLTVNLSLILLLVGCNSTSNSSSTSPSSSSQTSSLPSSSVTSSSTTSSSTSSSESSLPIKDQATISKLVNLVSNGTLNVKEGDKVDVDATITLTFESAVSDEYYQIAVNKTVSDMTWASDKLSCSFTLQASKDEELTIGVIKKNITDDTGDLVTFTQGEHYVIFGITSGNKYKPTYDSDWNEINVYFGIIVDKGYLATEVKLIAGDGYEMDLTSDNGVYKFVSGDLYTGENKINVTVEKAEAHTITYTSLDNIDSTTSILPTTFTGGDSVKFSFIATEGYSITDVEFSHSSNLSIADWSNFELTLPNQDIEVTFTTTKSVKLELESSEHISNVEFYKSVGNFDENDRLPMAGKITSWVPSYSYFYMVCNVDSGYKVYSIEGASQADLATGSNYYNYQTVDGRSIYKVYLYGETKLKVNLATQKTVSLDSSVDSSKISLIFDNDKTTFYPGDDVGFDLLLTDETKTRVNKVSYCYTDLDGSSKEQEITANSYKDHAYNFKMPNADTKIKVEIVDIINATVSYTYTNTTNLLKSVTFKGATTSSKLDSSTNVTSLDTFEEGETVNVEVKLNDVNSKEIKLVIDKTGAEIKLDSTFVKNKFKGSFIVPSGGTNVTISEIDKPVRSISTPSTSNIEFYTSTDEESKVDSVEGLGNLYDGDVFYFIVKDQVEEGQSLDVSVLGDGVKLDVTTVTIGGKTAYKVTVKGNITIEVSKAESVSVTIDSDDFEGEISDILYVYDTGENVTVVDGHIKKGTKFYIDAQDYGMYASKVTINGVITSPSYPDGGFRGFYEATGDIVITLAWEE